MRWNGSLWMRRHLPTGIIRTTAGRLERTMVPYCRSETNLRDRELSETKDGAVFT